MELTSYKIAKKTGIMLICGLTAKMGLGAIDAYLTPKAMCMHEALVPAQAERPYVNEIEKILEEGRYAPR